MNLGTILCSECMIIRLPEVLTKVTGVTRKIGFLFLLLIHTVPFLPE